MLHALHKTSDKIQRLLRLIQPLIVRQRAPLMPFELAELPDMRLPSAEEQAMLTWQTLQPNSYWGRYQTNVLLRTGYRLPPDWDTKAPLALDLHLGDAKDFFNAHPEALIYVDGIPFTSVDARHQRLILPPALKDHAEHRLLLHGWTGIGGSLWGDHQPQIYMHEPSLVWLAPEVQAFYTLAQTAYETTLATADEALAGRLLSVLDRAFNGLNLRHPLGEAFYASVPAAMQALQTGIQQAGAAHSLTIHAVGHAHIDTAWLWTIAQAEQKAVRTFHTALRLMEQYPEYQFSQSQPYLYEAVRRHQPAAFARIQAEVQTGRWEALGGMWIEADCNISGAEALVRQFVLGRRFYKEQFGGVDSPILWLPDAFGFPASLPQIAAHAGMRYFFTIKLRWSQFTDFPYDSFYWQGLDGTRLLAHMGTTPEQGDVRYRATYNSEPSPKALLATYEKILHKDADGRILMAYGHGDGGGGPTPAMLDFLRLAQAFPALPRTHFSTALSFFEALASERASFPTWQGELYLETHQGTLTSQAQVKADNHACETALHNAELLATMAYIRDPQYRYPTEKLRALWQVLCLHQFHDILPGSSIAEVYSEAHQALSQVLAEAHSLQREALYALAKYYRADYFALNATDFSPQALLWWQTERHDQALCLPDGTRLPHQRGVYQGEDGYWVQMSLYAHQAVALKLADEAPIELPFENLKASPQSLENDLLRVELNAAGDITRILYKPTQREVLAPNAIGNQLQVFQDYPRDFDAWNIDAHFEDVLATPEPAHSLQVIEQGALRATLEIRRKVLNSDIVQRITLERESARILFEVTLDWRNSHTLVKAAFPVDLHAPYATYGIQWGKVQRPTHRNTSADWARYEVPHHKYINLSEGNFGASLLSVAKYGADVRDNVMRLTLLKTSTYPDPQADLGKHTIRYGLLVHEGEFGLDTVSEAYWLNNPPLLMPVPSDIKPKHHLPLVLNSFIASSGGESLLIETVKKCEDSGELVVRLVDVMAHRGEFIVHCGFKVAGAWLADAHENKGERLLFMEHSIRVNITRPYQIVTLIIRPYRGALNELDLTPKQS